MDTKYMFVKAQIQDVEDEIEDIMFNCDVFDMLYDKWYNDVQADGFDRDQFREFYREVFNELLEDKLYKYTQY